MRKHTARTIASQIVYETIYKKKNLKEVFVQRLSAPNLIDLKPSIKALCYVTIRHYFNLEDRWLQCVAKRPKDKMVRVIMTQALAELTHLGKPKHVVVNEAINSAKKLNKKWACGLINSSLRQAVDVVDFNASNAVAKYAHPQWWIDLISNDWPDNWQQILKANNQKPPLWIRSAKIPANELQPISHNSIENTYKISAQDITGLKDFQNGMFSVQDASAQLAAHILDPQNNEKILDACAAPGGKTCHLLELNNTIKLDALELFPNRADKITENLNRTKLKANVVVADTNKIEAWFEGDKYDKILLDVPCSASGIIRRQPDIKYNRQPQDLEKICFDQQQLLSNVAKVLKPGGILLYATCSVFKQENNDQIKSFLKSHPEFTENKLNYDFAVNCEFGIQIITGYQDMDGFYYCCMRKNEL